MRLPPDFPYDPARWTPEQREQYVASRRHRPRFFDRERLRVFDGPRPCWPKYDPEPGFASAKEALAFIETFRSKEGKT